MNFLIHIILTGTERHDVAYVAYKIVWEFWNDKMSSRENRMASVQETIDALYIAREENLISDEEFILVFDEVILKNDFKHSRFPYTEYDLFNWETYDPLTCKIELRFEKDDIPHLQNALQIREWVKFYTSSYCSSLLLYCDMVPRFGRSVPDLCKITHAVLNHIFAFHRHRIENLNHPWFQPHKLAE